jgi:hypothetical protein
MTQAYFAPDPALRKALIAAARRGVDVRVIVPSFSDSALIFRASRADYDELLAGGVRIYEQRYAMRATRELQLATWRQRPWLDRFKEFTSSLFAYWL